MNYRAACPHCASVFRLGDDQLAAAAGWVQCGVCGAAFDARSSLRTEDGSTLPAADPPGPTTPPPEPVAVEPAPAETGIAEAPAETATEDSAPAEEAAPAEPDTPAVEPVAAHAPEPHDGHAAGMPRGIRQRDDTLDLPSIILIDPDLPTYDDPGPMPVIRIGAPEPAEPVEPAPVVPAPFQPATRIEYAHPPVPGNARAPRGPRRVRRWLWSASGALLLIALLAQLVWFLRDTLATRFPQARPAFEQACAVLGCTLSLPRDLDQLQIVGSDLQTEAGGRLRLVLTLGNRADTVQAWPVLVLTLTDQAGQPLARRSFAPSEYLDDPDRIAAGMPPRTEQPLNLPLTVRDIAPMGFDLRLAY